MTTEAQATVPHAVPDDARPYAPSWVDRLTDWIERLPGPVWASYLALLLFFGGVVNVVRWYTGRQPFWTLDLAHASLAVSGVYFLALLHHLDGVAGQAMADFGGALNVSDETYRRWRYELTTMPPRHAVAAGVAGAVLGVFALLWVPPDLVQEYGDTLFNPVLFPVLAILVFNYLVAITLVYHTVHQLRLVARIHAAVPRLNLLYAEPLHAFSTLTARTGMGYLLILSFNIAQGSRAADLRNPANLSLIVAGLAVSVTSFVGPLMGMHRRMVQEKQGLSQEVGRRLETILAEMHARVDARQLDDAPKLQAMLTALIAEREMMGKIPTWPWAPGTFRGFLTALLLPLAVWLLQTVVQRVTGL